VRGLIHGHKTVYVAVMEPEDGIEGCLRNEDHVSAYVDVDDVVDALKIGGELLVGGVGKEVEGLLLAGWGGAD